jgi:hypothetical protein
VSKGRGVFSILTTPQAGYIAGEEWAMLAERNDLANSLPRYGWSLIPPTARSILQVLLALGPALNVAMIVSTNRLPDAPNEKCSARLLASRAICDPDR